MQHICRICKQLADIPDYRAARSDYSCRPCQTAMRRERRADGRWKRYSGAARTDALREYEAGKFQRRLHDPAERPKILARKRLQKRISDGKLSRQPCEVCGVAPAEAHHDDYSRPFDVRWLCPAHHREHHRKAA